MSFGLPEMLAVSLLLCINIRMHTHVDMHVHIYIYTHMYIYIVTPQDPLTFGLTVNLHYFFLFCDNQILVMASGFCMIGRIKKC